MIREELLKTWTNLKPKLTLYPVFLKNKELIKDALEFHMNKSSEILSNNFPSLARYQQNAKPAIISLSKEFTEKIIISELEQQFKPTIAMNQPGAGNLWRDYYDLKNKAQIWNGWFYQRQKNQSIIEDCKELITKLKEF